MAETTELIARELGRDRVITADDDRFADYCRDESIIHGEPDVVVLADCAAQITAVLRLADEHGLYVTPRGAGSGMAGGCVAVRGVIVLSTERMQRIVDIDPRDAIAIVEPGVITATLASAADELGLYYPPDPASLDYSSLGGNIATNAGGPSALKYGVTGDYVLGLDVTLVGGEQLSFGRRTAKGVSGIDMVSPFVGSEGIFATTARATLALIPKPAQRSTLLVSFATLAQAAQSVSAVLRSGIWPCTLELLDRTTYAAMRSLCERPLPDKAEAALLIELDGPESDSAICAAAVERNRAAEIVVARNIAEARAFWRARRGISRALKATYPYKVSEDICVPRGKIAVAIEQIAELSARRGIEMACYGHAGDGNLHVNFLLDQEPSGALADRLAASIDELFELTIALRGTLSGEHGIGAAKRSYMPIEHSAESLRWQRKLKSMWDPRGLLNPGKVLPEAP